MKRTALCLLGLGLAVGLFALGRVTAPDHRGDGYRAGQAAGYSQGKADGVREGRGEQEAAGLPPGAREGTRKAFDDGYRAGANDVFAGYDGGWAYGTPYIITLARGGSGITYRFASRAPARP
jgi:hypothetical protein